MWVYFSGTSYFSNPPIKILLVCKIEGPKPNENVEIIVENMRDHGIILTLTLNNEEFQDLVPSSKMHYSNQSDK